MIAYPVDSVPDHCLECNGAVISRTTYSELFAVLGTVYGAGDGSTTFKLPDFRDKFLRGAGGANGAEIGVAQGDAIRNISSQIQDNHVWGIKPTGVGQNAFSAPPFVINSGYQMSLATSGGSIFVHNLYFNASTTGIPTADENRPVNYAIKYCIIYE